MATACGGLFTYGMLSALLGAILPEVRARLGFRMEAGGWLFGVFYLPQIPTVFVTGVMIDRFGKKPILMGGCLLAVIAVLGISHATTYALLAILLFSLGLAGSLISSSSNTLVADIYPQASSSPLNLGHAFFGLGAVSVPALVALLVAPFGVRPVLWLVGALVGTVGVTGLFEPFPAIRTSADFKWREARQAVFSHDVLLLAIIAFFTTALLASLAAWIRVFLEQCCGASVRGSSLLLTLFWGLISLGRFAASRLVRKISDALLVVLASFGFLVGLVMLALAPGLFSAGVAIGLCGLCYAPIYPTTVGMTHRLFPKFFGTALGILMATSLTGGLVLPAVVGYVAGTADMRAGIWVLVGSATLSAMIQILFLRGERARNLL